MTDVGKSLVDLIEENREKVENRKEAEILEIENQYLMAAFETLINFHKKGFAQGGSQIRNFTKKGNKIYMIDFEENVNLKYHRFFQIRDVMIFLLSLEKYKIKYDLKELLDFYENKMNNHTIKAHIKIFFHKHRWVKFLNMKIFNKIRMKDVRDFLKLLEKVEKL